MEKLVILDKASREIHVYDADPGMRADEEYLRTIGFDPSHCEWMSGDLKVIRHRTALTGNETAPPPLSHWQEWYWRKGGKEKIDASRYINEYERRRNMSRNS